MAERNSLLNCRTGNRTEGSNPSLSAEVSNEKPRKRAPKGFHSMSTQEEQGITEVIPSHEQKRCSLKIEIWNLIIDHCSF